MGEQNRHVLAAQLIPVLISAANSLRTLTYGEVAELVGRDRTKEGLAISSALKTIHRICETVGIPSLDALVVSSKDFEVGKGLTELLDPVEERRKIFLFGDWTAKERELRAAL